MIAHCSNCGAPLSKPGAAFCHQCGRPQQVSASVLATGTQHLSGPHLLIQEPGHSPRHEALLCIPALIGRDPSTCAVVVPHPTVSRQHARIDQQGAGFTITDMGSRNGTSVNGRRLQPNLAQPLRDGDVIRIGDQQGNSVGLTFRSGAPVQAPGGTIYLDKLNLAQLPGFTIGRDPGCRVTLDHPSVSRLHAEVRRSGQGHVIYDRSSNGTFVNGRQIQRQQQLQPGDRIQIGPYKLVYDASGFAQYSPTGNYRLDGLHLIRQVTLAGRVSLNRLLGRGTKTKRILNDVDISVYPREFVALVGASGAGKSTLMKALSGFTPAQGQVLLNGEDLYRNFGAYRSILGYVPQDDIIHQHLTVRSALAHSARLRLPDATPQEIERRIADVLAQVEMTEHAGKLVSKLSGGQRKRVSIAVELLAEPGLFFLDEPTSGLDPGLEKKMMYTLRQLADGGRTIVLVTHATVNIDQCDHVAFMADGYLAYYGPPREALSFFGAQDFADIYTRLSQPIDSVSNPPPPNLGLLPAAEQTAIRQGQIPTAEAWQRCFGLSPQHQQYVDGRLQSARSSQQPSPSTPQTANQRVSLWRQFTVLARRYFEMIRRDAVSLFTLLLVMPIIGMLLLIMAGNYDLVGKPTDLMHREIQEQIDKKLADQDPDDPGEQFAGTSEVAGSAQKLLFMLALAANLLGIFGSSYEIIKEEAIYRRERMVNLKILPYLLSKISVLGLFALLQCLLLLGVVRIKVRYPVEGVFLPAFWEMYITLVLAALASIALGLLISALVRSQNMVIYVILLVLFVQIIFAGAIFKLPDAAKPLSYLTTTRWTLEALGDTVDMDGLREHGVSCIQPEGERKQRGLPETDYCEQGQQELPVIQDFNVSFNHNDFHLLSRWMILAAFAMSFGALTMIVQRRKDVI